MCKVLIVEDDADTAEVYSLLLTSNGHEVRTASNAEAALESIRDVPPAVAVIDYQLEGGPTGNDLAVEIRRTYGDAIALVAATGYGDAEHRARAKEAGFCAVLVKPFDLDELTRALQVGASCPDAG